MIQTMLWLVIPPFHPYQTPLTRLWLQSNLHSSYIKIKYNDKGEIVNNIFSTYVEPLLNDINHPSFLQYWKINIDAAAYENKMDSIVYKPSV